MYYDVLRDGADPGGNLGATFTASLAEANVNPKGKFLDSIFLGFNATGATAAVVMETFVGLLNPFTFKAGQETRIQLRARDLIALMSFYYGRGPNMFEETTATGYNRVMGIRIPIQEVIDPSLTYTYAATRVSQTNQSAEVLALAAKYLDDSKGRKPIIAVELPYTTSGSTGYTAIGVNLPPVGNLIGLLIFQTTVPTNTTILYDVQRIQMYIDGRLGPKMPAFIMNEWPSGVLEGATSPLQRILNNYSIVDFRDEPFDAKAHLITFQVDVEVASEATRFIGIFEKA